MWRFILNSNVIGSVSQQYAFCRVIRREMRMRIDLPLDLNVYAEAVNLGMSSFALVVALDLFRFVVLVPLAAVDLDPLVVVDLDPFEAINCMKELSE